MARNLPPSRSLEPWIGAKAVAILRREENVMSPSPVRTVRTVPETGHGSALKDVDGKEYTDLDAGMGTLLLGYSPPAMLEAVTSQFGKLQACDNSIHAAEVRVELGELLQSVFMSGHGCRVLLETSGVHAVEAALKLARWHTRKSGFIALAGSLHGETYGALGVSSAGLSARRYFEPLLPGVVFAPYPYCYRCPFRDSPPACGYACVQYVEEQILNGILPPEDAAALVFETVQGRSCIVPPPGYFQRLRKLADRHGILLIGNECWTTPARTGSWSSLEHWDTRADILCAGEALAGGLPLGAVLSKDRIMDWDPQSHTGLLGASLLSCAVSLRLLQSVKEQKLVSEATAKGRCVQKRLGELQGRVGIVGDVRGKGLLVGLEVVRNVQEKTPASAEAQEILRRCWRRGVILGYDGFSTIRVTPSLTVDMSTLENAVATLELVISEINREVSAS